MTVIKPTIYDIRALLRFLTIAVINPRLSAYKWDLELFERYRGKKKPRYRFILTPEEKRKIKLWKALLHNA
jgi:hypothetical protein